MDTISPPDASLRACVHAMKHWVSSSGSNRDKTRRKVSCPGMPCGKSSRLANHSAWDLPYSSISSHPSAPPITAHTAMTRISIRRGRLLGAWGQRGSVNGAPCSCNEEGTSIPLQSSPVVHKAAGGKRFDHFNGKPSQFPNALTLDRHSSLTDLTQRSAKAFKFGDRGGSGTRLTPAASMSC